MQINLRLAAGTSETTLCVPIGNTKAATSSVTHRHGSERLRVPRHWPRSPASPAWAGPALERHLSKDGPEPRCWWAGVLRQQPAAAR